MLDIKHPDEQMHQKLTYVTGRYTRNFAAYLKELKKTTWIRYVVVEGFTVDPIYAAMLADMVQMMDCVEKVEILPYHSLGVHKWDAFKEQYELQSVRPPSEEQLDAIKAEFDQRGISAAY